MKLAIFLLLCSFILPYFYSDLKYNYRISILSELRDFVKELALYLNEVEVYNRICEEDKSDENSDDEPIKKLTVKNNL